MAVDFLGMSATRHRILIVEHDPEVMKSLANLVTSGGHDVLSATTGANAVETVRAGGIDLVLMDIELPDVSGIALCWDLRHVFGEWGIPIIATSDDDTDAQRFELSEAGADDFICKPVRCAELLTRVNNLLAMRAAYRITEQQRLTAEREAARWRLIADAAITVATASSCSDLTEALARVFHVELETDAVGYFEPSHGVWQLVAASGLAPWPEIATTFDQRCGSTRAIVDRIAEHAVMLLPIRSEGIVRGYLAVTSAGGFSREAEHMLREVNEHVSTVIATLQKRGWRHELGHDATLATTTQIRRIGRPN